MAIFKEKNESAIRVTEVHRKKTMTYYAPLNIKKQCMKECGDSALILYEFYLSKAGVKDYQFTDERVAYALDWDISKVKRHRIRLIKAKWYKSATATYPNGKKVTTYYIGKKAVTEVTQKEIIFIEKEEN